MPDAHMRLSNEESAAFDRWVSTVRLGGTPEQRAWSWARYLAALDKLTKATAALSSHEREDREGSLTYLHGPET